MLKLRFDWYIKSMGESLTSLNEAVSGGDSSGPFNNTDEMSESEISTNVDDLSDSIDQLLAGNPQNESKSQTDDAVAGKEKLHKNTEQEDELLAEIAGGFTQDTDVSPDINSKIADIINDSVSKKLAGKKVNGLLEKYPRPKNCNPQVPNINPEIWAKLPGPSKSRDIRMQKAQKYLKKTVMSLACLADNVLSAKLNNTPGKIDLTGALRKVLDAVTLTGLAQQDLYLKRRELLKPDMNPEYRQLCSSHVPVTTLLFGDDLPKSIKDLNETNKVAGKLVFQGFKGRSTYGNKGKHFLGNRPQKNFHKPMFHRQNVNHKSKFPRGKEISH